MEENPLNKLNTWITIEDVNKIMKEYNIDYKVNNIDFFKNAFIHKSYLKQNNNFKCDDNIIPLQNNSYERMEWLGDSLLNIIISKYLYKRFPNENEGFLSRIRTYIVKGDTLCSFSKILNFSNFLIISNKTENDDGRESKKILNNVFESFLCAIYLDSNIDILKSFLINFIEKNVDFVDIIINNDNYKDQLIRYVNNNLNSEYKYYFNNLDDSRINCCLEIEDKLFTSEGINKKKLSQEVSKLALKYYNLI